MDITVDGKLGNGSGLIVDDKGTILTCDHVIYPKGKNPDSVEVVFKDKSHTPQIIMRDEKHDLALLRVKGLTNNASFMKYDDANLGDECMVMGFPVRLPHLSMAKGIVSAKGSFLVKDFSFNLLQVDARINHGYSGGPVFETKSGKVIGIASMKYVPFLEKVEDLQNYVAGLPVAPSNGIKIQGIDWGGFFNYVNESIRRIADSLLLVQVGIGWVIPSDFCLDFLQSEKN